MSRSGRQAANSEIFTFEKHGEIVAKAPGQCAIRLHTLVLRKAIMQLASAEIYLAMDCISVASLLDQPAFGCASQVPPAPNLSGVLPRDTMQKAHCLDHVGAVRGQPCASTAGCAASLACPLPLEMSLAQGLLELE